MKQLALTLSLFLTSIFAWSQCTPDPQYTLPGYYSKYGADTIPAAYLDTAYDETITLIFPTDSVIGGVAMELDSLIVNSIGGLPTGIIEALPSNTFLPGQASCIQLTGKVTIPGLAGNHKVTLDATLYARIKGSSTQLPPQQYVEYLDFWVLDASWQTGIQTSEPLQAYNAPNPFDGQTVFYLGDLTSKNVQLDVFNMVGSKVHSQVFEMTGGNQIVWDAKDQPEGLYVYSIKYNGKEKLGRLVITDQ